MTYSVQQSDGIDGPWTDIATGLITTSTTISGLDVNTGFYVRIKKDTSGVFTYSEPVFVVMLDQPDLSATGGLSSHIKLEWIATCAENYRVYKFNRTVNDYIFLAETGDVTVFNDFDVHTYENTYYYITAVTPEGYESEPSKPVSAYLLSEDLFDMSRATQYQGITIGKQASVNTAVAVTKRLRGMAIDISPTINHKTVKYAGTKAAVGVQKGKTFSEGSYEGVLDPHLVCYIMRSLAGAPVATTPATGAFQYVWSLEEEAAMTPSFYTLEQGSSAGAEKYPDLLFNSLSIKLDEMSADISGDLFAGEVSRNITQTPNVVITFPSAILGATSINVTTSTATGTIAAGIYITAANKVVEVTAPATITGSAATLTVTALAAAVSSGDTASTVYSVPNIPSDPVSVGVYYSTDNVTWTRITDNLNFDMNMSGFWNKVFHVRDDKSSWDDVVEMMPDITAEMVLDESGASGEYHTFYGYMTEKTKIYIGFQVNGALITGSTYERLQFRWPVYVVDANNGDDDGVFSGTFGLEVAHDSTFKLMQVTAITRLPVLF